MRAAIRRLLIGCICILVGLIGLVIVGTIVWSSKTAGTQTGIPQRAATASVVSFRGAITPPIVHVGEKLVVELSLGNLSGQTIDGFSVFSNGPWQKYTIVNVFPGGQYESGFLGHTFTTWIVIPPGQTRAVSIVAYPNEPGSHEFTFIPKQDKGQFKDAKGESIVIGGKVSVIR